MANEAKTNICNNNQGMLKKEAIPLLNWKMTKKIDK